MSTQQITRDAAVQTSRDFLEELFHDYQPRDSAVRFWDGTPWEPTSGQSAKFTLVLQHPGALRRMFWRATHVGLGEAYIYDDFDIEGDMTAFTHVLRHLQKHPPGLRQKLRLASRLLRLPNIHRPRQGRQAAQLQGGKHSRERDRQAI